MTMSEAIGSVIRRARMRRGLSQEALAERVGTARCKISVWEKGLHTPTFESLLKIAKALDTTAWNLLRCAEMRLDRSEPAKEAQAI